MVHFINLEKEKNEADFIALIHTFTDIGNDYFEAKNYDKAERIYQTILLFTSDYPIEQIKIHLKLSTLYQSNYSFDKVIQSLELAETVIQKVEIPKNDTK
ncbi:MAG: hypothetical protein HC803_08555 [Saprospiraceae bacterium]|nr:hypothetical protein [Saprospiraceae bacterium]